MKLFHYTKKCNLKEIKEKGLMPVSKYNDFNSDFRKGVIYCWLKPEHDLMGYKNQKDYCLLEIDVEEEYCDIANMDWISSAYVNLMVYKNKRKALIEELVNLYVTSAVKVENYSEGDFRAPEVLIRKSIPPDKIKNIENKVDKENINLTIYRKFLKMKYNIENNNDRNKKEKIIGKLLEGRIERIAVHDDSTGILITYRDKVTNKMFTVEIDESENEKLIEGFLK